MATIVKTSQTAVLQACGAAALPADGVTQLDYQQAEYRQDFEYHQVWINLYRRDKTRMLLDLYRNNEVLRIVMVWSGRVVGEDVAKASIGTLSTAWFDTVQTKLNADPTLGGIARTSFTSSIMTDGGVNAGSANPKSVAVMDFSIEYYTEA